MPDEKHILRILGEATEPLSPSEITDRLNHELGAGSPYTMRNREVPAGIAGSYPAPRWALDAEAMRHHA